MPQGEVIRRANLAALKKAIDERIPKEETSREVVSLGIGAHRYTITKYQETKRKGGYFTGQWRCADGRLIDDRQTLYPYSPEIMAEYKRLREAIHEAESAYQRWVRSLPTVDRDERGNPVVKEGRTF